VELSLGQQFELERTSRTIDNTTDLAALRQTAKMLLHAFLVQQAAAQWAMRQQLIPPAAERIREHAGEPAAWDDPLA
jgi:hypothetical protein